MFENVDWEKIINETSSFIKEKWQKLIIKIELTETSYRATYYYSSNGKKYIYLLNEIKNSDCYPVDKFYSELKKINSKFKDYKEKMLLTIKANIDGNVKVQYKHVENGNKLPYDEVNNYMKLNEQDEKF